MASDAFQQERKILDRGENLLAEGGECDFKAEYKKLLKGYKKLLKVTKRVIRVSDSNENKLKSLHSKVTKQQEELEETHKSLEQHAEALEGRVENRTKELVAAQEKLEKLIEMGIALSRERNLSRFKELILSGAKELTNADGGALLLRTDDDNLAYELFDVDSLDLHYGGNSGLEIPFEPVNLRDAESGRPDYYNLFTHAVLTERTINVANIQESKDFNFDNILSFDQEQQYRSQSYLAVPLKPSRGEVIGLLLLSNARVKGTSRVIPFSEEMAGFVEGLASQAAVAMVNQQLVDSQRRLLDSLIKMLSGAIDAKSPYTGDHCGRMAQVGEMLAQAACESEDGGLAEFDMNETEWREFKIASWMHDCGKVTMPEYVVDKATKLETIYNRIHEIRTRFEVVLRDLIITKQNALLGGKGDPAKLQAGLEEKTAALKDNFAFVAECNVGGEFMDPEKVERLKEIAKITWERHFDDRLGLSQDELRRVEKLPAKPLPVKENLLADKKEQIIPRPGGKVPYDTEKHGIEIDVPEALFNQGELYNLSIPKGTLTNEERFKIQEHAIQTIVMLDRLPFPKELSGVKEIAGCHHETMIGTGYPRKMSDGEMTIKSKILAIADIFEALTAADRPYKKPKTLSESIRIMSFMRNDQHIDPELFDLLLTSGVYAKYAKWNLKPSQIDKVEISQFISQEQSGDR
jgi:HD-GYP domain-containing protein (c-di-GMP phosphodiesterase class II)